MGMPFEVGKTLLQVEYKPKEGVTAGTIDEVVVESRGDLTDEESVVDDAEGQSARFRNVEASVRPFLSSDDWRLSLYRSPTPKRPRRTSRTRYRAEQDRTSRRRRRTMMNP